MSILIGKLRMSSRAKSFDFAQDRLREARRSRECTRWIATPYFIGLAMTLSFLFISFSVNAAVQWRSFLPGLQQATWSGKDSLGNGFTLELFKIDPKQYKLQLVQATDYGQNKISAKEMVNKTGGLLAVNAGFFDTQSKSMGLLVRDGNVLNPLRPVSWWGIFSYDKSSGPRIDKEGEFAPKSTTEIAVQVGPRLIDDNHVMPLKKNDSQKTFIGITQDNQLILGVTDMCAVDATDLANTLLKELQLKEALNFDGGGSTQLYAKIGSYEKDLVGVTSVANGVVLVPRR